MLVRFGDLRLIINLEGSLECTCSPDCPNDVAYSDPFANSLRGLQLDEPTADTPKCAWHPNIDRRSPEQQLIMSLGDRPTQDNLRRVLFSFANVMAQLSG